MNRTTPTAELAKKYAALQGPFAEAFEVVGVEACNHRPHPYTIGSEHVALASDKYGGRLGGEVIEVLGCAHRRVVGGRETGPKCGLMFDAHVHDTVLFVKPRRDLANKEAADALFSIKALLEADLVDGVGFPKSEFTIAPPEPKETP